MFQPAVTIIIKNFLSKTEIYRIKNSQHDRVIIVGNKIVECVSHFNFLGCDTSYKRDKNKNLGRYQMTCGTIQRTLRTQDQITK